MPHINSLDYQLRGNGHVPFVAVSMQNLMLKYNNGIESTTKGDFPTALE